MNPRLFGPEAASGRGGIPLKSILALLLSLTIVTGVAGAQTCAADETDVDTGDTPAGRYYVVSDCDPTDACISLWIYQESNGKDGLQRCDEVTDDTACQCFETDTILF